MGARKSVSELEAIRAEFHERWMEKEHERAATDLHNFDTVFPAVGDLIDQCVRAALSHLGQAVAGEESTAKLAKRLRDAVAGPSSPLPAEADLDWYLRWMDELVLDAEAIDHFRSNYSGDSTETYKGILPNKVGWGASNAFVRLFNAFDGDIVRKVERRVPQDAFPKVFNSVEEALKAKPDPALFMGRVLESCGELVGSESWDRFGSLPYPNEVATLRPFLSEAPDSPPPDDVISFWFSIGYPIRAEETVADADVFGSSHYEPGTDTWDQEPPTYEPRNLSLNSEVLASIYRLCGEEDDPDVRNFAEYALLLGWTAFVGREITRNYAIQRGRPLGAIAGFHDGDWIDLGWIDPRPGLEVARA